LIYINDALHVFVSTFDAPVPPSGRRDGFSPAPRISRALMPSLCERHRMPSRFYAPMSIIAADQMMMAL
jgi:hypothetical protein